MRPNRPVAFLLCLFSTGVVWADIVARYDAGLAAGPPPVSPTNYVFNSVTWTPIIVSATGITNAPVTNDIASGFNAWKTSDNTIASGSVTFTYPITNTIDSIADEVGWKLRARMRMTSNFGGASESCFIEYGTGPSDPRFLIFFGLDASGNLTAQLQGFDTITLTSGGVGATNYHLHEIVFIGGTPPMAQYYFDGQLWYPTWQGFTAGTSADGVRFGTGSTAGKGSANFNLVEWEVFTSKSTVTTFPATNVAAYVATLSANLDLHNAPATAWFEWGATTNYGNTTSGQSFGSHSNAFSFFYQSIAGLSVSNTYHFRCVASNAFGVSFGADAAFTTPMLFSATTLSANNVEPHRATLSGSVNPSGLAATAWFEWGATTNYGNKTTLQAVGSGLNFVDVSQLISGLASNATFNYRCVASNAQNIVFGQNVVFTTPPVFTVTNLLNTGAGTLRTCIASASAGDTITFGVTGTITLSSELLLSKNLTIIGPGPSLMAVSGNNATRVFTVTNGVTVNMSGLRIRNGHAPNGADSSNTNSPGASGVSGGGIFNRGTLNLSNCVITANAGGLGGDGFFAPTQFPTAGGDGGDGGGIYNVGTLTLTACTVSGNAAGGGGLGGIGGDESREGAEGGTGGNGGGIYNSGMATVSASTLTGNVGGPGGNGGRGGGGRGAGPPGRGGRGRSGGHGSVIYNAGTLSLIGSTVSGNTNGRGGNGGLGEIGAPSEQGADGGDGGDGGNGSIYSSGSVAIAASTISSNFAGAGGTGGNGGNGGTGTGNGGNGGNGGDAGGVLNSGLGSAASLRNALIAFNTAGAGGAGGAPNGNFGLNGFGPDVKGPFTSEGHNLIGKNDGNASFTFAPSATGDQFGSLAFPINPLLGPLANRGGPTFTMSLLPGSPARDAGDDLLAGLLTGDQRGYLRLSGAHVDIGAFEVQWVTTNNRPLLVNPVKLGNGTFQFAFTNVPGAEFTVLTSTNVSLPLSNWTVLSGAVEISPGQFLFTNSPSGANRFYLIRWP